MFQKEKGERKFQKQRQVTERERKEIKACCRGGKKGNFRNKCRLLIKRGERYKGMLQREKGESTLQKQMLVAERQEKEIKACCRGKREKGSFRNK